MTPEAMRDFYDYTYWAFERVWECILALSDEQFTQPIDYSIGSVRNHVVHMMSGTWRWVKRMEGAEILPHLPFDDYTTRAAAKAKWDEMKAEVLAYVNALDQTLLNETVHWEIPTRGLSFDNRRWEILLHVANHATEHRAQILALLHHHFGVKTVEQDMIFYLVTRSEIASLSKGDAI